MGNMKIFLFEITMPKKLIFGMWNHLVVFYQVCSNYALRAKMAPPGGHMFDIGLYRENMKKSPCLKP